MSYFCRGIQSGSWDASTRCSEARRLLTPEAVWSCGLSGKTSKRWRPTTCARTVLVACAHALLVALHGRSGQRDDGDVACAWVFLEQAGGGHAVDAWQAHVHQDQFNRLGAGHSQPLLCGRGAQGRVTCAFQDGQRELQVGWRVFDDEDAGHDVAVCPHRFGISRVALAGSRVYREQAWLREKLLKVFTRWTNKRGWVGALAA